MVLHTNANDASSLFSALRCVCAGVSFRLTIGFAQVPHYPFTMLAVPAYYHYPDNKQRCFRTKIKAVDERITYGSKNVRSIRTCLGTVRCYRAERLYITNLTRKFRILRRIRASYLSFARAKIIRTFAFSKFLANFF